MINPWKVVIVGGGFGGLYAAQQLKSDRVDVTLIDRRNYHLFQPLLDQSKQTPICAHAALLPTAALWKTC
jgi:NADH dehydrogenase FAD-containing subunit